MTPGDRSWPRGLNSFGHIAGGGYIVDDQNFHAFFWDGNVHILNDLVDLPAGWSLPDATDINDYGQIAADLYTGQQHIPARLTPEPAIALRAVRPGTVEAVIRPGANRTITLQTSTDLRDWSTVRAWPSPGPAEVQQITAGHAGFFRVVRL